MSIVSVLISLVVAFAVTAGLGFVIIPWLRKLHFGQTILDIGPVWHKKKQGTPNMGGLMFIIGIVVAFIVGALTLHFSGESLESAYSELLPGREIILLVAGLCLALGNGIVGFTDDFIKIKLKRNEGLSAKQKSLGQLIVAVGYVATLWFSHNTVWYLPFAGSVNFERNFGTGLLFWVLSIFIIYGTVNSVNLTDGIDGLSSSVTIPVMVFFTAASLAMKRYDLALMPAAMIGGLLAYLSLNWHPAKLFMGDTGSLFMGGVVCAMSFALDMPLVLILVGFVYICETLSVILQVSYFKATHGKRLFKMAPIHHHFEMCGWSEVKIFTVFTVITVICCTMAFLALRLTHGMRFC